jgi:hypothetical protein
MAKRGLSMGIKRRGHKTHHSPPSSAEVKNAWNCTSTPPYAFMTWCLVKKEIHFHGVVLKLHKRTTLTTNNKIGTESREIIVSSQMYTPSHFLQRKAKQRKGKEKPQNLNKIEVFDNSTFIQFHKNMNCLQSPKSTS